MLKFSNPPFLFGNASGNFRSPFSRVLFFFFFSLLCFALLCFFFSFFSCRLLAGQYSEIEFLASFRLYHLATVRFFYPFSPFVFMYISIDTPFIKKKSKTNSYPDLFYILPKKSKLAAFFSLSLPFFRAIFRAYLITYKV
jgi:hypothetical protein